MLPRINSPLPRLLAADEQYNHQLAIIGKQMGERGHGCATHRSLAMLQNGIAFNREPEEVAAAGPGTVIHRDRRLPAASARRTRARRQSLSEKVPENGRVFAAGSSGSRLNE